MPRLNDISDIGIFVLIRKDLATSIFKLLIYLMGGMPTCCLKCLIKDGMDSLQSLA